MVAHRGIVGALGGCYGPNYAQPNGPNFGLLITGYHYVVAQQAGPQQGLAGTAAASS